MVVKKLAGKNLAGFFNRHIVTALGVDPAWLRGLRFRLNDLSQILNGKNSCRIVFSQGLRKSDVRKIFATPGLPDLKKNGDGDIEVSLVQLEAVEESVLGEPAVTKQVRLLHEAKEALPEGALIIVGADAPLLLNKNELLACQVTPDLPVFRLGVHITSLKGSLEEINDPEAFVFLIKNHKEAFPSFDFVLERLADIFVDGFPEGFEVCLKKLASVLSPEELSLFINKLNEREAREALVYLLDKDALPSCPRSVAETIVPRFIAESNFEDAEALLARVPDQIQIIEQPNGKTKRGNGRKTRRAKQKQKAKQPKTIDLLAPLKAHLAQVKKAEVSERKEYLQIAFDGLCDGGVSIEEFRKLRSEVVELENGGRLFALPLVRKERNSEAEKILLDYFFEKFDPERPELFSKVVKYAEQDFLIYDLVLVIVDKVYAACIAGGVLPVKEAKVLDLMLALAKEEREFLPSPEKLVQMQQLSRKKAPRFAAALRVVEAFYTKDLAQAKEAAEQRNYQKAWEAYQRVLEVKPDSADLIEEIGGFLKKWRMTLDKTQNYQEATEVLELERELRGDSLGLRSCAVFFAAQNGDWKKAIKLGEKVVTEHRRALQAEQLKRMALLVDVPPMSAGEVKLFSETNLETALMRTATDLAHAYTLKYQKTRAQADFEQAIVYVKEALKLKPDYVRPHHIASLAYAMHGDLIECLGSMDKFLKGTDYTANSLVRFMQGILISIDMEDQLKEEHLFPLYRQVQLRSVRRTDVPLIDNHVEKLLARGFNKVAAIAVSWMKPKAKERGAQVMNNPFLGEGLPVQNEAACYYLSALTKIDREQGVAKAKGIIGAEKEHAGPIQIMLANHYMEINDFAAAAELLVEVLKNQPTSFSVHPLLLLANCYRVLGEREQYIGTLELIENAIRIAVEEGKTEQFEREEHYHRLFNEDLHSRVNTKQWESLAEGDRVADLFASLTRGENSLVQRETGIISRRFTGEVKPADLDIECSQAETDKISQMLAERKQWRGSAQPIIDRALKYLDEQFPDYYAQASLSFRLEYAKTSGEPLPVPLNFLGDLYMAEGNYEEATRRFNEAVLMQGENMNLFPEADINLIKAAFKADGVEGAGTALFSLAASMGKAKKKGLLGQFAGHLQTLVDFTNGLNEEQGLALEPQLDAIFNFLESSFKQNQPAK